MRKMRITAILAVFTLVFSGCKTEVLERASVPEQLKMVPSDALVIVNRAKCSDCLSALDSGHVFRRLRTGVLSKGKATLSFCYTNTLTPILAIETDKAVPDTTNCIPNLIERADELGLKHRMFGPVEGYTKKTNIVITTTETMMSVINRHQDGHSSILDAPDFANAIELTAGAKEWTIFRNSGASKFIPKDFLKGLFAYRDIVALASSFAEWTCISPAFGGGYNIRAYRDETGASFIDHLDALEPIISKLPSIVPDSTSFVLDLPMDAPAYRKSYEKYLDAQLKLEKYKNRIDALRSTAGKSPLKWEEENGIQEVALVKWLGHSVVAVKPANTVEAQEPAANKYQGFIPALYGSAFQLADDSFTVQMNGWIVIGSQEDVIAFMNAARPETFSWPARKLKFMIDTPELQVYCASGDIKLEQKEKNDSI